MTKIKRTWIISLVLLTLFLIGCRHNESMPATGNFNKEMMYFDRAMIELIQKWEIPGGSLTVLEDGEIVLSRGYGYANVETAELVQPDSIFRIASVSKPITATAVLKLVEQGKLRLGTPAFQLLDQLLPASEKHMDPRINEITIQHLLEHTAGWESSQSIDPMFMAREIGQEMGLSGPANCTGIIQYMLGQPLDFNPGSQYAYSNFGYCVLGRVIEEVSGMEYDEYVQANVLEPCGAMDMQQGNTELAEQLPGEVHYYAAEGLTQSVFTEDGDLAPWPYGGFYLEAMDAHGGWVGTATDLAVFAYALEGNGEKPILSPDSLSILFSLSETYSYGWKVRTAGRSASWWSTGSMPGTTAILYRKSDGLIWVALFNTRPDTIGDEFLVDVITQIGKAAIMDKIVAAGICILLVAVIVVGIVFFRRRSKKNFIRT